MKIPLYQAQTQLGADSGARSLTAMASPDQYGKLGDIAFQTGAIMVKGGQVLADIAVAERKQETATLLAGETSKFREQIFKTQTSAVTDPVGQSRTMIPNPNYPAGQGPRSGNLVGLPETQHEHLARLERGLQQTIQRQAKQIKRPAVRKAFLADANDKLMTAMPGIRQQLRLRYLDHHRATMNVADKTALQAIGTLPAGPGRDMAIENHLRKVRYQADLAGETAVQKTKREDDFRSAVDENDINARAYNASTIGQQIDPATGLPPFNDAGDTLEVVGYRGIIQDIEDGKKYRHLDPAKKIKLLESLKRDMDSARRRFDSLMNRGDVRAERQRKRTQLHTFENLSARIATVQDAAVRGEPATDAAGNVVTLPTITDFAGTHITDGQRTILEKQLDGEDRIYNPDLYIDYLGQVDEAVTDADLTAVYDNALQDRMDGRLGGKALTAIKTKVDSYKTKTPAALEQKRYLSILKTALNAHETMGLQGIKDTKADLHNKAEALSLYQRMIGEGVRPEIAYLETVKRYDYNESKIAGAMIRGLPSGIAHGLTVGGDGAIVKSELTKAQARAAVQKIRTYWQEQMRALEPAAGVPLVDPVDRATKEKLGKQQRLPEKAKRLPKSKRMRIRDLYALEKRIKIISESIENMKGWKAVTPAGGGEPKEDDGGWLGPVIDYFQNLGKGDSAKNLPKNMRK